MTEVLYQADGPGWAISLARQRVGGNWLHTVSTGPHPGVVVVGRDTEDRIAMIRETRHPVGADVLNLPRGFGSGRGPLDDARREFNEETGLVLADPTLVGHLWPDSGLLATRVAVVTGRVNVTASQPEGESTVVWGSGEQLARESTIDGISAAALWLERMNSVAG